MWNSLKNMKMKVDMKLFKGGDYVKEGIGGPSTKIVWWV
jgi:hypothetical protein